MSEDVKKAICLCVFTCVLAGAWCFDAYLDYKAVFTQEQTKRLVSLDNKNLELAKLRAESQSAAVSYWPRVSAAIEE